MGALADVSKRTARPGGVAADVPCAAVSQAATPRQTHVVSRLDGLAEMECGPAPLLVLVGRAMEPLLEGAAENQLRALIAQAAEGTLPQD